MNSFSDALNALFKFLDEEGQPPPTREVCVIEIPVDARMDERGRVRIARTDFRDPADYESRFEMLIKSGLPWVNISCYGVLDGKLVVAIEPSRAPASLTTRTSLNYSGPVTAARQQDWSVDPVLVVD